PAGMALPHPPRPTVPAAGVRSPAQLGRLVATAPAVGVFMPHGDVAVGSRVRAGDRLGIVDMLGVPQDVVAPSDGVLAASLVEPGEGVEYGQELLVIEASS
ncbi:MAG: acetyl-CoA carboxylase biotin carboxyl carrier protein, partial [Chloroflexi bacterium]|nr:acetyl-CoA carboxylase biotin carboxyl carrier protein [Chloroflexota bacterium]